MCNGAGSYFIVGAEGAQVPGDTLDPLPHDAEHVDPCDHCHGTGTIATPVLDEEEA